MSPRLCRDRAREALAAVVDTGVIGSRWTDRRKARVVAVPSGGVRWFGVSRQSWGLKVGTGNAALGSSIYPATT